MILFHRNSGKKKKWEEGDFINLKAERRKANITQSELAKKAGVSQSAICDIENGKTRHVRFETAYAISQALGIPVTNLCGCTIDELLNEDSEGKGDESA